MSRILTAGPGLFLLAIAAGASAAEPAAPGNPLVLPWTGPHGGIPPFDRIRLEHFAPAFAAAIAERLADVARIANDPAPPNFANTIAALERSGRTFDRVNAVFGVYTSTMSTPELRAVEQDLAPRLAALEDRIYQDEKLYARIAAVHEGREKARLTAEQKRLAWLYATTFARYGARLAPEGKARLSAINQRLATLYTTFNQNLLADETDRLLLLDRESDLAGLPDSLRAAAAASATARGHAGKWAIQNTRSSMEPFLTYSDRRDLRETVWTTYYSRGDHGDAHDNNAAITEILALRAERAKLLGYATHAHWNMENTMAATPDRALALMEAVWTPAVARVREEVRDMQAVADTQGAWIRIAPWDYRYYAEKVRKAKYDLDQDEVKGYLQLDKLREGMFHVAGELFGLHFRPLTGIPVCHPDVSVWEVTDLRGRPVGLWYFDPYARPGKRSGAWMSAYRRQERMDRAVVTIVSNNANFVKGAPGAPVLVSWTDAETLFHEFGHALHGLLSNVTYPYLSGTSVARDYVEFPSQVLEHWLSTPEILGRFALHHRTGQPMPKELVERIARASTFNQGFSTVEALASALVDMKLHLAGDRPIDPDAFERETLHALGMPAEIVMRHRTPQFAHIFSSDEYSAGYYSYTWSDTLSADAWSAFTEGGGPWDKAVGKRLRDHVFSVGNTVDPAEAYRAFRGRDPKIDALMAERGFPMGAK